MDALKTAALCGVDVRLMLPEVADNLLMRPANRAYYEEALQAGVRIFLRKGEFIHAKTFVCDDYLSSIGSANLDFRSFAINYEVNSYIYDEETALMNKGIFMYDLRQCHELTLEAWNARPWYSRIIESFMRLFAPLPMAPCVKSPRSACLICYHILPYSIRDQGCAFFHR